jgi:hypothetical protein
MARELRLDAEYYISKTLIPPLERIFNLVGANVRNWYDEMPKVQRANQRELLNIRDLNRNQGRTTLHTFMKSRLCIVCKQGESEEGKTKPPGLALTPRLVYGMSGKLSRECVYSLQPSSGV